MSRVSKSDVNKALAMAAKHIVAAGGENKKISRTEVAKYLKTLSPKERGLTDIFFKFIDHKDFKTGAVVTPADVAKALDYAKKHMVAKYDLNNDGLSKDEIAKMSLTGKRAVDLAKALKAAQG